MNNMIMRVCFSGLAVMVMIASCEVKESNFSGQLEIHDIQGCSHTSPYKGQKVKDVVGVVTHKVSNGFTMQSISPDDQFCTSEGIFVFTKDYPNVMVADLVRVDGYVDEFTDGEPDDYNLSQTEISKAEYTVIQSDHTLPQPFVIDDMKGSLPTAVIDNDGMMKFEPGEDGLDFFESLESMLVEIRSGLVVASRNDYNEIIVVPDVFTHINLISKHGAIITTQNDANPEKLMIKLPSNYRDQINMGDRFQTLIIGVMDYSYGNFKLMAYPPIEIISHDKEVEPFVPISNGLTLATYNLENLSPMDENIRFTGFARHIVKMLHSPDVLVVNEIMDNSGSIDDGVVNSDKTIIKLINAIQKAGGPNYSFSDTPPINNQDGGLEGGNIRTVLLYREDNGISLEESDPFVNGITNKDGKFLIRQNPSLIGENSSAFKGTRKPRLWLLNQNGRQFFVVGVHLTSQGANSPDWGNQQPPLKPEEGQRVKQADLINEELSDIHLTNPDIPIFIAGDMNDIPWSKTMYTLSKDIFSNTADPSTPEENYSYIFEGNAQTLDFIFVNQNLVSDVLQARFVHVNTYLDKSDAISDHDPVIIEFQMD